MRISNFTTFYFQLLHHWHYDCQFPTSHVRLSTFFTSDSVRYEAGGGGMGVGEGGKESKIFVR